MIRLRFAVWIVVAIAIPTLTITALKQTSPSTALLWLGAGAFHIVLLVLLRTTPPNAIKLPKLSSVLIVLFVTAAIQSAALSTNNITRNLAPLASCLVVTMCIVVLMIVHSVRIGRTPWTAAIFGWNAMAVFITSIDTLLVPFFAVIAVLILGTFSFNHRRAAIATSIVYGISLLTFAAFPSVRYESATVGLAIVVSLPRFQGVGAIAAAIGSIAALAGAWRGFSTMPLACGPIVLEVIGELAWLTCPRASPRIAVPSD